MSYLTQMAGLAVQNFVSAGGRDGRARRGRARHRAPLDAASSATSGTTSTARCVYILLPLALVLAVILISQGVVQTFHGHATATTLEGAQQTIARGPAASQIAIKQLGTNGGGFYNSNSAVPFENPNGLTNFFEMLAILLIPAAQVFMFGKMVLARRHALDGVRRDVRRCSSIGVAVALPAEQHGSQVLRDSGVNITQGNGQSGGNMSDKEVRFGIANTAALGGRDDATPRTARSTAATTRSHAGRRRRAAREHVPRRGDLRRRRLRPLRDVLLHPDRRLRRRADGRPNAGVARARRSRRARSSSPRSARCSCRRWCSSLTALAIVTQGRARLDLQPRRPRLHRDALRLRLAGEQQRQRVRRLRRDELLGRASARSRCYLGRFVPLLAALALGGSLAAKKTVPGLGRHVPHRRRRRSSSCSSA